MKIGAGMTEVLYHLKGMREVIHIIFPIDHCKLIIDLFSVSTKDCDITVESNTANVVHKADIRFPGYLHGSCLTTKLKNDGSDLGSPRCADGMAL